MQPQDPGKDFDGLTYHHNSTEEFLELSDIPEGSVVEVSVLNLDGTAIIERIKIKNSRLYVRFLEPGHYTLMIQGEDINRVGRIVKY